MIFLVVLVAQFVDLTIGTLSDVFADFAISPLGLTLFVTISMIYGFGQFFILNTVRSTIGKSNVQENRREVSSIRNGVTILQYVLVAVMALIILQLFINSWYYTSLLAIGATISYGLGAILMGVLAFWFLSWFRRNKALVVLLYGLATIAIAINAVDTIIYFDVVIFLTKPVITTPDTEIVFPDLAELDMSLVSDIQAFSLNSYFILTWAGTILLLRHNIQRIGKMKFWVLVTTPIVFFMSFYLLSYELLNVGPSPTNEEDLSAIVLPILLVLLSAEAAMVLFGLGFRSIARSISQSNNVRNYMMITAYGVILFFTAAAATISGAGYPPFGIVNVLLVGPFSYLILIGLYGSAISVAEDAKLRQSIRSSTRDELKLLDNIAIAQLQREIERKVMATTRANAEILTQESGVQPTLTDEEIRGILSQAAIEIGRKREGNDDVSRLE